MLAYSSNVGAITIADKLGRDRLIDYQKRFGLGKPTVTTRRGQRPAADASESSYGRC